MAIKFNLNPLEATKIPPYLWRTTTYNNSDLVELYINLRKSQKRWGVVAKVLGKMGAPIKTHAMMYTAVLQAVLLYGSKIWMVTYAMVTVLEGFYHRISGRVVGMTASKGESGEWEWASVNVSLDTTGIFPKHE